MKNRIRTSMLIFGVALLANAGLSMATVSTTSVLHTLTVTGYTDTGASGVLEATGSGGRSLNWYSSGYGIKSNASEADPEHAVDNNGNKESLLINFGASKQLNGVTIGWNGGRDSDITVLAWNPSAYMANLVVAAPTFDSTTKYSTLIGQGWSLVGNYANLAVNTEKSVNITNPVSSSYWLLMAYNADSTFINPSDRSESEVGTGSADYGKFYSVSYSPGTTNNRVPEPSTALLLGAALFGLIGQRSLKPKV